MATSETVNPRLLKSNIDLLARVTKKPNMVTEKALSRPPFKFLHDLVTLIVKTTGYLRGLFTEDEFNFEYVKDSKESKLAFLDKLIDAIGFINGKGVDVKSAKIVAGSEVEKTNKLLNELAKAVLDKKPFVEAVEKVRKGQKPPEAAVTTSTSTAASTSKATAAAAPAKKTPAAAASKAPTKAAPAPALEAKHRRRQPKDLKQKPLVLLAAASKAEKPSKKPATLEPEIEQPEEPGTIEAVAESEKSLESSPKSLELVETIETPQGLNIDVVDKVIEESADLNDNSSKPSSAKEDNLQSVEPMAVINNNNNNLDNNLDQLVAGLGLDDDEEEENGNALGEGGRPQQPEDSGIDSSSKSSVSANNGHSPKSGPDSAEISPRSTAFEVSSSTAPLEDQEAEMPRAADRKRSATIKSSRRAASSKSGAPNQNTGGMTNGQLLSRTQNVPSSAAPMSYAATTLPPNIPPPPYEESPQAPPPSAAAVHQRLTTAAQRTSARPSSSRPAPPRVKTASRSRPQLGLLAENRVGEQVAAAVWPPPEVLALDLDLDDRGDGEEEAAAAAAAAADEYVMSSQKLQEALLSMDNGVTADLGASINSSNNQGRLVQQLMETKSELEGNVAAAGGRKTSASVTADTSLSSADTKVLRERVQLLCQSVGGLSKALNYLHEDVEPMVGELAKWSEEYRANSRAVERLQAELAKAVDPLRRELEAVELEVRHAAEQLINAKAAVHRNALTIARMIEGV
ncbi:TRAF3-interacting protein 1 [Tyrophagus putrescentiae]|nr:TRAF3-interacting protein 1 [Tyrophagus putrescentiae]